MPKVLLTLILLALLPFATAEQGTPAETDSGQKTLVWPDGTRYVGGVKDGKRSGKGTIFWEDGTRFVGQFENDMRNGPGRMILPDGTEYSGVFKDDELVSTPAEEGERTLVSDEDEAIAIVVPDPYRGAEMADMFDATVTELDDTVREELTRTVDLWGSAWADQNVTQYLANYSDLFAVPGNQSRSQWEALRRSRLRRPDYIRISIDHDRMNLVEADVVDVFFKQTYRSDVYSDETDKVLRLRREGTDWRIISETSR